jgi:DNA-binding NarL/FixJ family response regulator
MNLGRPLAPLQLEREQREQLEAMASSRSLPHGLVTRVRIILLSADGWSNKDIAARLRLNQVTVGLWRRRSGIGRSHPVTFVSASWQPHS